MRGSAGVLLVALVVGLISSGLCGSLCDVFHDSSNPSILIADYSNHGLETVPQNLSPNTVCLYVFMATKPLANNFI